MSIATQASPQTSLGKVLAFLDTLDSVKIHHRLAHVRHAIMVEIDVPGEMWEVGFFEDGEVEVERFVSTDDIEGEEAIDHLFALYSD